MTRLLAATALALFLVGIFLGHVTARASRATVIPDSSFHDVTTRSSEQNGGTDEEETQPRTRDSGGSSGDQCVVLDLWVLPAAAGRFAPTAAGCASRETEEVPPDVILDPAPSRTPVPRAAVEQPAAVPLTVEKATPRPATGSGGVTGTASWFCGAGSACTSGYPDGLYAAAGPALRVGDWRGRTVTVCASACVAVTLIDWCGCPGGRVIDLYRSAFSRLASPSAGTVRVSVSW